MKSDNCSNLHRRAFLKSTALGAMAASISSSVSLRAAEPAAVPAGKRIGFVDLNLDNYHANVFLQALRGPLLSRGFTVAGATGT